MKKFWVIEVIVIVNDSIVKIIVKTPIGKIQDNFFQIFVSITFSGINHLKGVTGYVR